MNSHYYLEYISMLYYKVELHIVQRGTVSVWEYYLFY